MNVCQVCIISSGNINVTNELLCHLRLTVIMSRYLGSTDPLIITVGIKTFFVGGDISLLVSQIVKICQLEVNRATNPSMLAAAGNETPNYRL